MFHSGSPLAIRIRMRAPLAIDDFVIGIGIFNAEGVCCYGTNTSLEELKGERLFGDAEAVFTIESLDLVEGTYKLDVAIHKADGYPYDYHRLLYTFRVKSRTKDVGHLPAAPPVAVLGRHRLRADRRGGRVKVDRGGLERLLTWRRRPRRRSARCARRAGPSSSPTACSTCCIPGTSATCSARVQLGDALFVGLNGDASVRRNKGDGPADQPRDGARRSCWRRSTAWTPWCSSTRTRPAEIIRALQPDVLVKGADWAEDRIVGRDTVEARGGRVVRVTVEEGYSTSALVQKVRAGRDR